MAVTNTNVDLGTMVLAKCTIYLLFIKRDYVQFKIPTRVFFILFFRITNLNFNNRHDHKTAGRRAWLHYRWWWNPTMALCIYRSLAATKRRLILQLVAQVAHEPACDSLVDSRRICSKFKFRDRLFTYTKIHSSVKTVGNLIIFKILCTKYIHETLSEYCILLTQTCLLWVVLSTFQKTAALFVTKAVPGCRCNSLAR